MITTEYLHTYNVFEIYDQCLRIKIGKKIIGLKIIPLTRIMIDKR